MHFTVTEVEDNVSFSDPEPMWESKSTSASIFKLLCKQRYTVVRTRIKLNALESAEGVD